MMLPLQRSVCLILALLLCSSRRYFVSAHDSFRQVQTTGEVSRMAASEAIPSTMKAILAENDTCVVKSVDTPSVSGTQVLVKVAATAINRADTLQVSLGGQQTSLSLIKLLAFCSVKVPSPLRQEPLPFWAWRPLEASSPMGPSANCRANFLSEHK